MPSSCSGSQLIYVHVPFCRSFCTYCDFYSEIPQCRRLGASSSDVLSCAEEKKAAETAQFNNYADGLCAELESRLEEVKSTLDVDTLYIGGGTPSVLPLSVLGRIIDACAKAAGKNRSEASASPNPAVASGNSEADSTSGPAKFAKVCGWFRELTVEVNPEDIVEKGFEYAKGLRGLGVNRVSMGVQSLDDSVLKWMNRRHSADGARKAFKVLREAGFENLSVDVIFGLGQIQGASETALQDTLKEIAGWHPEHISAYQLSIEEGSALAKLIRAGRYQEADDEACRQQYELICSTLATAGYVHYEISNWALPSHEAVHNSAYWTRAPYVGLGPGAHSLVTNIRSWNEQNLVSWRSASGSGHETLSDKEIREEQIMLGLRTAKGIEPSLLSWSCPNQPAIQPQNSFVACQAKVMAPNRITPAGLEWTTEGRLRIPEKDFFVSDAIISSLLPE